MTYIATGTRTQGSHAGKLFMWVLWVQHRNGYFINQGRVLFAADFSLCVVLLHSVVTLCLLTWIFQSRLIYPGHIY